MEQESMNVQQHLASKTRKGINSKKFIAETREMTNKEEFRLHLAEWMSSQLNKSYAINIGMALDTLRELNYQPRYDMQKLVFLEEVITANKYNRGNERLDFTTTAPFVNKVRGELNHIWEYFALTPTHASFFIEETTNDELRGYLQSKLPVADKGKGFFKRLFAPILRLFS